MGFFAGWKEDTVAFAVAGFGCFCKWWQIAKAGRGQRRPRSADLECSRSGLENPSAFFGFLGALAAPAIADFV
jgi:hypothetical protein